MPQERIEKIGKYISILYRQAQKYIGKELQPYGLSSSEHLFLVNISRQENVNQRQLAHLLGIDEALVTRGVARLEKQGLVRRERDAQDMRSYNLSLTEKGQSLLPAILDTFQKWNEILSNGFTQDEMKTMMSQLQRMSENAANAVQCSVQLKEGR